MRHLLFISLLFPFSFSFFFFFFFFTLYFLGTSLLDFPAEIFGLKSVFQVTQVFVFLPKQLLRSPRTMDKIINDMLTNFIVQPQLNRCLICQAFNCGANSVTGSRDLQRYSLIQDF